MNQVPDESSFEYTLLDEETRTTIIQRALEIKNLMRLTAENIISIGAKLSEVKEQLEHGSFQSWLRTEFEWSEQTARQFMQVYRWAETIENKNFVFSRLATSALYLLAAPSTPPEAREEVLDLVEGGERVTYTRARTIVNHHKSFTTDSSETEIEDAIEVTVQSEAEAIILERDSTYIELYRLETQDLGCLVRLYRADELVAMTEMTIGATVTITVGRRRGQTAKIIEILTDTQALTTESEAISSSPARLSDTSHVAIRRVEATNLSEIEKLRGSSCNLIISYDDVCLAVESNSQTLAAFVQRLQTDSAFVREIFPQVLTDEQ